MRDTKSKERLRSSRSKSAAFAAARQLRESPLRPPAPQRVIIVSAAHDYHCKYPKGDYINMISAINKQVSRKALSQLFTLCLTILNAALPFQPPS